MFKELFVMAVVTCCSLIGPSSVLCQSYNFENDYLEVYPDPTDPAIQQGRTPLYFGLIQSLGGPDSLYDGSGSVAGVKVALDRINNDTSLLPGYTLHYTFTNSMCNITETFKAFFSQILNSPPKLAIIGAGCSPSTERTAEISYFYNITQISCVSSSSELKNRLKYPYYFQMLNTEEIMAYAFYAMFLEFGWKKVEIIVQDESLFRVTIRKLKGLFDKIEGFNYTEKLFLSSDGVSGLGNNIFENGYRIFLFATYVENARELLCKAYHNDIRFPKYLLLTYGWYECHWWRVQDDTLNCSVHDRESVLPLSLAFLNFEFLDPREDLNLTTDTGITGGEFLQDEDIYLNQPPLNLTYSEYSQYCYDGVWTLAYALNKTISELQLNSSLNAELAKAYEVPEPFTLQEFSYTNNILLKKMFEYLSDTSFKGITGTVEFGRDGIRMSDTLTIFQFQNVSNGSGVILDWVKIAGVKLGPTDNFTFTYSAPANSSTLWNGLVPFDGVPRMNIMTVNISVTVIFAVLATIGIAFSIFCFIFNLVFHKSKLVRLASSKLNCLIIGGALLIYSDIVVLVIPTKNVTPTTIFCNLSPWLSAIGYSLCFGTIIVKMGRVYYIFNNPTSKKKKVKDWALFVSVLGMVVVDITILTSYTILSAVSDRNGGLQAKLSHNLENRQDIQGVQDVIIENYIYTCETFYREIFLGVLYGYKVIIQLVSLILALSIRKVKVKGVNDAKYIGAATYVVSIIIVILILTIYFLSGYNNTFIVIYCTGFFVGVTTVLGLVFVPLMIGLYKDPSGETVFESSHFGRNVTEAGNGEQRILGLDTETDTLKKKLAELEDELEVARNENEELKEKSTIFNEKGKRF